MIIHEDILNRYDEMLKHASANVDQEDTESKTSIQHLRWMINEIRDMSDVGKANRWLGFIQGVMVVKGLTTVDAERDFTRPYFKPNKE